LRNFAAIGVVVRPGREGEWVSIAPVAATVKKPIFDATALRHAPIFRFLETNENDVGFATAGKYDRRRVDSPASNRKLFCGFAAHVIRVCNDPLIRENRAR
jgi:hypothetical protein